MNRRKRRWETLLAAPLLAFALVAAAFLPAGTVRAAETADAADAYRCSISIPVQVTVSGDTAPQEEYTFTMEKETADAPMPENNMLIIGGSGSGSFASIEYTVPGDYVYRVYQIAGKNDGMTYDTSTYQVTVRVVNTETGGLTAEIWAVKNDSDQKVDSINFDNQYDNGQEPAAPADPGNGNGSGNTGGNSGNDGSGGNSSSGSGSSGNNSSGSSSSRGAKTGDNSQIFLYSGLMAASLLCCGLFVLAGRRERRKSA